MMECTSLSLWALLMLTCLLAQVISTGAAPSDSKENRTCYNPANDFYGLMGTRTAYDLVHGNIDTTVPKSEKCEPMQIWMVTRHGTRDPENEAVKEMQNLNAIRDEIVKNHQENRGSLCKKDLEALKFWELDRAITNDSNEFLTMQGALELHELAKRWKEALPELLDSIEPTDYLFRSTESQRANASMRNFAAGLLGREESQLIQPYTAPFKKDRLLRPNKMCPAWDKEFKEKNLKGQQDKFTKSDEITSLVKKIKEKLGYSESITFDDKVKQMYDICRFETAWYLTKSVSPWCKIFNKEDLMLLEYREDLDFYYTSGVGRPMSAQLGCGMLSDMFEHFSQAEKKYQTQSQEQRKQPKGVFYFAHTMTMQMLFSALNLFNDTAPPTPQTYANSSGRSYRTSKQGSFATNLAAVLYDCAGTKKVTFHVAENILEIPGCNSTLCDWNIIQSKYKDQVEQCTMDFCGEVTPKTGIVPSPTVTAAPPRGKGADNRGSFEHGAMMA